MARMLATFFLFTLIAACITEDSNKNYIDVIDIVAKGSDSATGEFCAGFSVTKDEAQYFFNNATQVSVRDLHDNYSFLPCHVQGTGLLNNKRCEWEIRAGGTGSITCTDGSIYMACDNCLPIPEKRF